MKKSITIIIAVVIIVALFFIFAESLDIKKCFLTGGQFKCYWIWDIPEFMPF